MKINASIIIQCFISLSVWAQNYNNFQKLIPRQSEISLNSQLFWVPTTALGRSIQPLRTVRLGGSTIFNNSLSFHYEYQVRFLSNRTQGTLTDLSFTHSKKWVFDRWMLPKVHSHLNVGRLQWVPNYKNIQVVLENASDYLIPERFWGASFTIESTILPNELLTLELRGFMRGISYNTKANALIQQATLKHHKQWTKMFSTKAQIGQWSASRHFVNYFSLGFRKKWDQLEFKIDVGKLPTVDASPYGVRFEIRRTFKYISLSFYYEERYQQHSEDRIAGLSWGIVGPDWLARLANTFRFAYNINNNALMLYIPLIQIKIDHK